MKETDPIILNLQDNSKKLLELVKKYSSLNNIPDDELDVIDFVRDLSGRVVRKDALEQEKHKQQVEANKEAVKIKNKELGLMEKSENKPFGLIEINLGVKDLQGRRVSEKILGKAENIIQKYEGCAEDLEELSSTIHQDNQFLVFKKVFIEYLLKEEFYKDEREFFKNQILTDISFNIFCGRYWDFFKKLEFDSYIKEEYIEEAQYLSKVISSAKAMELHNKLEKLKGKFCDVIEFDKDFQNIINEDIFKAITNADVDISEELITECEKNSIKTLEDFIVFYLKKFIIHIGLEKIIKTQDCQSLHDFVKRLQALNDDDFPVGQELKIINIQFKKADIESKKELSQRKKDLVSELKRQKSIINGMIEAISPQMLMPGFFKKLIDQLQDCLVAKGKNLEAGKIYLDGTPNQAYDSDPGEISGDCTSGQPLPFDNPEIPVYNIKVFNTNKEHFGNIYLLSTRTIDDKTCWHLEAIQIPGRIDWNEGASKIINGLAEEAKKKNIEIITINRELHHISNYDYIQTAFFDYYNEAGLGRARINVPMVEETEVYSHFQGDGNVLVVWKNAE